jgi:nucleoid-associated protein YgaU
VLFVGTGHVVANRGGAPASASAIRPATVYVVQAGDTLWSIGERFHGHASLADYVDELISVNGGTHIQPSQALTLP